MWTVVYPPKRRKKTVVVAPDTGSSFSGLLWRPLRYSEAIEEDYSDTGGTYYSRMTYHPGRWEYVFPDDWHDFVAGLGLGERLAGLDERVAMEIARRQGQTTRRE